MAASTPQTVRFEMVVEYNRIERGSLPSSVSHDCDTFEDMLELISVERRRRKLSHRATGARYRMHLTEHGQHVCGMDADRALRHADAINGTWFKW